MPMIDVSHQTITTQSNDEAESLAGYLNEHGIFAFVTDEVEVRAASANGEDDLAIRVLKSTWRRFWESSDSGLFGLPLFVKEH